MDMIWVGARDDNEKDNSSFSVFRIMETLFCCNFRNCPALAKE